MRFDNVYYVVQHQVFIAIILICNLIDILRDLGIHGKSYTKSWAVLVNCKFKLNTKYIDSNVIK